MENSLNILPDDYVELLPENWKLLDEFIPPKEVCHYTSTRTALEYILFDRKLLLGNLNETNDPRESKWLSFQYNSVPRHRSDVAGNIIGAGRLKDIKVLCTCCHNDLSSEIMSRKDDLETYKYGAGRSSMWAHYANMHEGVCFIFNGKSLHDNIQNKVMENGGDPQKNIRNGFVMYDYRESFGSIKGDIDDVDSLMENYDVNFLRKSPEWRSEHEFRWLVAGKQNSKLLVSIENAINAVIVGADFRNAYYPLLEAKSDELNFQLGRIAWENGQPRISFNKELF